MPPRREASAGSRWNPLTPLAAAVFVTVVAYTGPQPWSAAIALMLTLCLAAMTSAGAPVAALAAGVGLPTFSLLFVMNGIVAPEELRVIAVGPLNVALEAAPAAAAIAMRLSAAVAALGWMVLVVSPRELARALADRGLPAWAAYLLIASLDAVPQARRRAQEVLDAQRARGMRRGRGAGRVRALLPAAGPLIVSLVSEAEERALALDARGFRPHLRRTTLDPLADVPRERVLRAVLWAAALASLIWRFAGTFT